MTGTSKDALIFTDFGSPIFLKTAGANVIATSLRNRGYTVKVIDHFLLAGIDVILKIIDRFVGENTRFVGWSTTFLNVSQSHISSTKNSNLFDYSKYNISKLAVGPIGRAYGIPISDIELDIIRDRIKSINPRTQLVMGGPKADFVDQRQIDAFILGYADNSIIEYIKYIDGENPNFRFRMINETQMVVDYDTTAASHDFSNSMIKYTDDDIIYNNQILPIEVSRGCIFKCRFCSFPLNGKKKNNYIKNQDTIYTEMMRNYEKYGTTKYIFSDDTYNESVEKLDMFAAAFRRLPFKIQIMAYVRHDLIHRYPEMADLLLESGLVVAMFGIETLNHEAGKLIGKGLHPDKTIELLHWLRYDKGWKDNVLTTSGFIVGLPTETKASVNRWITQLSSFDFPLDSFTINPLMLDNTDNKMYRSEFERDYYKYGYNFNTSDISEWNNEHWSYTDVSEFCKGVNMYMREIGRVKIDASVAFALRDYGYTLDQISNMSYESMKTIDVFSITMAKSKKYFEDVLS